MELMEYVKENEKLILSFYEYTKDQITNYKLMSAISALDITNEAQEHFVASMLEKHNPGQKVLRLYGLLQGLFVSIDSLYALSYNLTKNKRHININQNEAIRELKYIRNDVVGHPSNRVYEDSILGYCILKKEDIGDEKFTYSVHINGSTDNKTVDLKNLLTNYYIESNQVLSTILSVLGNTEIKSKIENYGLDLLDRYLNNEDYMAVIGKIKTEYLKNNILEKTSNRIMWRIDLVEKINAFTTADKNKLELKDYALAYEIEKICELTDSNEIKVISPKKKLPKYLSSLFRFFHQNPEYSYVVTYIYDATHPIFLSAVNKVKKAAITKSAFYVIDYMDFLLDLYKEKKFELIYAFGILIKKYNSV